MNKIFFKYRKIRQFKDAAFNAHRNNVKSAQFIQTTKLHGTNASIVYDIKAQNIYTQSRNKVNSSQDSHMGFAEYVEKNREQIITWFKSLVGQSTLTDESHVVVYGEWVGPGIQKNVALTQLEEKLFVVFDVKLIINSDDDHDENIYTNFPIFTSFEFAPWYSILDFPYKLVTIDFQDLEASYLDLENQAETVAVECPVGKQLGVVGKGEGHVYVHVGHEDGIPSKFKVKGKEHQNKKQVSFDVSNKKYNEAKVFAESVTSMPRLEQGIQYLEEFGHPTTELSSLQFLIPWVIKDIHDEEDIPENISVNFLNKEIANITRNFFNEFINTKLFVDYSNK